MSHTNEWTLMFFVAGDNQLSPSMVSQLKAIKDAGYQENTTVLVRFDPNEIGARTKFFDVNRERKKDVPKTVIGDGRDPFVRNLREDVVISGTSGTPQGASEAETEDEQEIREVQIDSTTAEDALDKFLHFCRVRHPAKHYMLFCVGHGMIVGNDTFLPDERPATGISLLQLGESLRKFAEEIRKEKGTFELVGMHSCSMSAVEVVYQLKGTAKYMMATEGVSFVGSWPYRQLLKKLFNTIEKAKEHEAEVNVEELLKKLHFLSLHNSTDFMFAGFSHDLCLSSLRNTKVEELTEPLKALTKALKAGLEKDRGKQLILLAHWQSQSYWQENYTDLYDFCRCLRERCKADIEENPLNGKAEPQGSIASACEAVMNVLAPPPPPAHWAKADPFDRLVVFSDYFGPTYQYSHGLSIYFPWSKPIEDDANHAGGRRKSEVEKGNERETILERYGKYAFTTQLGEDSWLSFLEKYFVETRRKSRAEEGNGGITPESSDQFTDGAAVSNPAGGSTSLDPPPREPVTGSKTSPSDSGGVAYNCGSIKNYPREFVFSPGAAKKANLNEEGTSRR